MTEPAQPVQQHHDPDAGSKFAEMTANPARNVREGRLRIVTGVFVASSKA